MPQFLGFGSGADGVATLSGTDAPVDSSFPTTSAGATGATIGTGLAIDPGDFVWLHQTRGTNAGDWEVAQVASYDDGTGAITFANPIDNSYTDSGNSQAQLVKINEYSALTVSGTLTLKSWDGNVGGALIFMCSGPVNIPGTITGSNKGYRGGIRIDVSGNNGEGDPGWSNYQHPNGSGGGGGTKNNNFAGGGGGGGYGAAGTSGGSSAPVNPPFVALGGEETGDPELTQIFFGGGGGRGGDEWTVGSGADGGNGGGLIIGFCSKFNASGSIVVNGENGDAGSSQGGDGGGGAGGAILIKTREATLGTNVLTATGGSGANHGGSGGVGGNGAVGRIRVEACAINGSTNPSASELEGGQSYCGSIAQII